MKWKWPLNNIFNFIYFHFISYPSGSTRLSIFIPQNSHYSSNIADNVLIIFFFREMNCSFKQTFVEESPLSFSLSPCQKKQIIHASALCSRTLFLTWRCNAMGSFHSSSIPMSKIFCLSQCLYWWFNFYKKKSTHYCDLLFILSN